MIRNRSVEAAAAIVAACIISVAAGCSSNSQPTSTTTPPSTSPAASAPTTPDPASVHANESGVIPVLAFRDIVTGASASDGNITASDFKKDLDWLYAHNYRPVSLIDLSVGKVDCPAGTTPVVLTFDDGLPGQYRIDKYGNTDPNCAIAILESFNSAHPDFPLKGTFFVSAASTIAKSEFGSIVAVDYKLEHLAGDGFDIGCAVPASESTASSSLQTALATANGALSGPNKGSNIVVAIQPGAYPKDLDLLKTGSITVTTQGGPAPMGAPGHPVMHNVTHQERYTVACVVTNGDKPSASPASPKFDPLHVPSIAISSARSVESALKSVKDPFISDGDPTTITVPEADKSLVVDTLLTPNGVTIKTYPSAVAANK